VSGGRYENDPLTIGDGASRKTTNRAIEKLLILIELHNVVARTRARQNSVPWLPMDIISV
jgi:hypothetical protein